MTRAQIILTGRLLLDETEDKVGYGEPILWNQFVDERCNELARLDGFWVSVTQDIVSGQSSYTLPPLYRRNAIVVTWPDGSTYPCAELIPQDMDNLYNSWRSQPATGQPDTAVLEGNNSVILYPQPNYNQTAGLIIEGYACPTSAGASAANVWPNPTDNCPLPEYTHQAIAYGAAARRCIQYPTADNRARMDMLEGAFRTGKIQYFKEVQQSSRGLATGDGMDGSTMWNGW